MSVPKAPQPSTHLVDLPSLNLDSSYDASPKTISIDPAAILTSRMSTSTISMRERRVSFREQKETAVHDTAASILFPEKK